MKTNSIFQGRLYNLPVNSKISLVERKIIEKILSKSKLKIEVESISLVAVEEDYDFYQITDKDKGYELKFSLDHKSEKFLAEIKNTKTSKSLYTSKYLDSGVVKVGDKILYLICDSDNSETLYDYGRSELTNSMDFFCECYCDLASFKNYRTTYKTNLKKYLDSSDMSNIFDKDQKEFISGHSDYKKCELIINSLKADILESLKNIPKNYTGNIVGEFNKNSIFFGGRGFTFKDLRDGCKGHVYSDIANIVLFYGLSEKSEKSLISNISARMSLNVDFDLYKIFYNIELRKKALHYLLQYLKEVYVYESDRIEVIVSIIDSFSQSYERLCKIPVFKEHRKFILSNITEPILDGRPQD